jgi:ribosome biogenesis protein ERB1
MGLKQADKKRKSVVSDPESDDELGNGLFDGVLSASEDEEDYIPSGEEDGAGESESEVTEGSEDEEDEEDDDALLSDDIPSDIDGEEEMGRLVKEATELEITEPGVDPKRKGGDSDEQNYRIEKDANGGERYVYECVA